MSVPRSFDQWHEDHGNVLWWRWPISQPPYVGTPLDLGRSLAVAATVVVGIECYDLATVKLGETGGWPFDENDESFLFWTPLPDCNALDKAIRDYIRGGPDPFADHPEPPLPDAQLANGGACS